MTKITRKGQVGQAGNPGQFAAKAHTVADDEVSFLEDTESFASPDPEPEDQVQAGADADRIAYRAGITVLGDREKTLPKLQPGALAYVKLDDTSSHRAWVMRGSGGVAVLEDGNAGGLRSWVRDDSAPRAESGTGRAAAEIALGGPVREAPGTNTGDSTLSEDTPGDPTRAREHIQTWAPASIGDVSGAGEMETLEERMAGPYAPSDRDTRELAVTWWHRREEDRALASRHEPMGEAERTRVLTAAQRAADEGDYGTADEHFDLIDLDNRVRAGRQAPALTPAWHHDERTHEARKAVGAARADQIIGYTTRTDEQGRTRTDDIYLADGENRQITVVSVEDAHDLPGVVTKRRDRR
ncbi:hypothetical protein [Brevibacterium sp. SMBL_HHYL_HB1]|uniref:hypothetical protein n=1 Tax=Brevibacterium sp. SMBL_HHYL_HB1 TaxID=2777556 RepID=UPI001BABC8B3|nr:hypothetical protein [Brevibacterium sp. SMBL_HHYL_HB1]QUL80645.1 hypothetical protein IG171_07775 [Brevibacterium sp. SMBL_HHYL_HB1]